MNVSMPSVLRQWVEKQARTGAFETSSEYVRHLVRTARKDSLAREMLEAELFKGLESGPSEPWTPADSEDIRRRVQTRLSARRRKSA